MATLAGKEITLQVVNAPDKAQIRRTTKTVSKATRGSIIKLVNGNPVFPVFEFPLNPKEITRNRSVKWDFLNSPGTCASVAEWVRTDDQTIKFSLLIAARSSTFNREYKSSLGVLPDIAEIESWTMPDLDTMIDNPFQYIPPPMCVLTLGPRSWKCVVEDYTIKEKIFKHDLTPILCEVDISLRTVVGSFNDILASAISLRNFRDNLPFFESGG